MLFFMKVFSITSFRSHPELASGYNFCNSLACCFNDFQRGDSKVGRPGPLCWEIQRGAIKVIALDSKRRRKYSLNKGRQDSLRRINGNGCLFIAILKSSIASLGVGLSE